MAKTPPNCSPSASASSRTQTVTPKGPRLDAKERLAATRTSSAPKVTTRIVRTGK